MTPSRLEILGVTVVMLGVSALIVAAFLFAGVVAALVVAGVALTAGGFATVKAAGTLPEPDRSKP